jgi:hypothetical protein
LDHYRKDTRIIAAAADEIYEINNTWRNYEERDSREIKFDPSVGQNAGLQNKLFATYEQNA